MFRKFYSFIRPPQWKKLSALCKVDNFCFTAYVNIWCQKILIFPELFLIISYYFLQELMSHQPCFNSSFIFRHVYLNPCHPWPSTVHQTSDCTVIKTSLSFINPKLNIIVAVYALTEKNKRCMLMQSCILLKIYVIIKYIILVEDSLVSQHREFHSVPAVKLPAYSWPRDIGQYFQS